MQLILHCVYRFPLADIKLSVFFHWPRQYIATAHTWWLTQRNCIAAGTTFACGADCNNGRPAVMLGVTQQGLMISTSSVDAVQAPLDIVQRRVAVPPVSKPVTPEPNAVTIPGFKPVYSQNSQKVIKETGLLFYFFRILVMSFLAAVSLRPVILFTSFA